MNSKGYMSGARWTSEISRNTWASLNIMRIVYTGRFFPLEKRSLSLRNTKKDVNPCLQPSRIVPKELIAVVFISKKCFLTIRNETNARELRSELSW